MKPTFHHKELPLSGRIALCDVQNKAFCPPLLHMSSALSAVQLILQGHMGQSG